MFGRVVSSTDIIYPTRVSFDGVPRLKAGGISIDLTTVAAASGSDTTLPDGSIIRAGHQFLRYGQVMCEITAPATDVVTISGSPTGGTFLLNVNNSGGSFNTSALAYNATGATVQTAILALANVGAGNATVSGSGGGPYTITYASGLGATQTTANATLLTGGTPAITVATNAPGGNIGFYGPYDPSATDGRQTLTRGQCFVLDETVVLTSGSILPPANNIRGGVIDGGIIWQGRVIQAGSGSASLTAGPTLANFLAAFPGFSFAGI